MSYILGPSEIFSLLFVMLGPFGVLIPFAKISRVIPPVESKKLAYKSAGISVLVLVLGGFIGSHLLKTWHISVPILEFTSGLIFLFRGFSLLFFPEKNQESEKFTTSSSIAYKVIVNPWGLAAVVGLLAMSRDWQRTVTILGVLLFILLLDLLFMIFNSKLTGKTGMAIMKFLGNVFVVLQVALAMNLVILSLRMVISNET